MRFIALPSGLQDRCDYTMAKPTASKRDELLRFVQGRIPDDMEQTLREPLFILEHDWWRALKPAIGDYEDDYRLPFPVCIFEFSIGFPEYAGVYERAFAVFDQQKPRSALIIMHHPGNVAEWLPLGEIRVDEHGSICRSNPAVSEDLGAELAHELLSAFGSLALLQARAALIVLDAGVVTSEVVANNKLNRARQRRGKQPLSSYHVLKLRKQGRSEGLPADAGGHSRKRLHLRRGHWRNTTQHGQPVKRWINWMLVGDPDLGFIDKEYRL